jgi:hypothetical protein
VGHISASEKFLDKPVLLEEFGVRWVVSPLRVSARKLLNSTRDQVWQSASVSVSVLRPI